MLLLMQSLDLYLCDLHALAVPGSRWVRVCGCGTQDLALIFQHESHAEGFAAARYIESRVKEQCEN